MICGRIFTEMIRVRAKSQSYNWVGDPQNPNRLAQTKKPNAAQAPLQKTPPKASPNPPGLCFRSGQDSEKSPCPQNFCPRFWGRKWLRHFMGTWKNSVLSAGKPISIQFLLLGEGGWECRFDFHGREDFFWKPIVLEAPRGPVQSKPRDCGQQFDN